MSRSTEWKNVPLEVEVECTVRIKLKCSGYYDPGCMYLNNGDPGYPPEGDDVREVQSIEIIDGDRVLSLTGPAWCQIEEFFENEIMDAELPQEEECE